MLLCRLLICFFFFQAEDGIRDGHVTGVQTCALPIFYDLWLSMGLFAKGIVVVMAIMSLFSWTQAFQKWWQIWRSQQETKKRSEERRVGKECRDRWGVYN